MNKDQLWFFDIKMKETLIMALRTGGKILIDYFEKPHEVQQKESQSSIVTEADFASNSVITEIIRDWFPTHNILSEETGFTNNNSEYTWIIDPLDGTSNFAAGIPWFGVLISLFKGNTPVMGGAYLPVSDIMYFAEKGKGAFRNGIPIKQIEDKKLRDSLFAFCVDYTDDLAFLEKGVGIYKYLVKSSRNIRSTNSLIDFIYIAEGKFGGLLNLYTKVWDIAGLSILITETGGLIQNVDGEDLLFKISDEISEINFAVVAGTRQVVGSLNKEISKLNTKI